MYEDAIGSFLLRVVGESYRRPIFLKREFEVGEVARNFSGYYDLLVLGDAMQVRVRPASLCMMCED